MAKQKRRKARQGSVLIYELIARMSSDEKRYFKIYAQKYEKGDSNLCLSLFNAINVELRRGAEVTDEAIRARIKGHNLESYFVSAKNKLKNMLCDALYEMHSKHTDEFAIMKGIGIAGILNDRGFAKDADKQLKQAMDMAKQKEYFTLWLEGFRHKVNYSVTNVSASFPLLHSWRDEMEEVVMLLDNYSHEVLNNRLTFNAYLAAPDKIDKRTVSVFNENCLTANVKNARSAYAKYLALNALLFYYEKAKRRKEVSPIALQQKNILYETLNHTVRYAGEFFVAYQNYLNSLDPVKQAEIIIKESHEMEKLAQQLLPRVRNKRMVLLAVNNATMIRLNVFIEHNNIYGLKEELPHAVKLIAQTKGELGIAIQVVLSALIKDGYFITGNYTEALKWIRQIKSAAPPGILNHYKLCNLLTELMILIDTNASVKALRNSEENLRLAITRFNYTVEQQKILQALLKLLSAVPTARNAKELEQHLNRITDFAASIKKGTDGTLKNVMAESNAVRWAQRKMKH
ncbi:MAG TPA: hypothetical protein VK174_00870 [Chitinophagales bacterium]|nr:hypothetical protein [Chitinophagales bacterium]